MLRRTTPRAMVPFHPVVVGGRPSERGMLYRDSQQNSYTRVQAVAEQQRTEEEARMHSFLRLPELYLYQYFIGFFAFVTVVRWLYMFPLERNTHKQGARHTMGAMNYDEVWKRNTEMAQIFAYHRDLIDTTRREFGPRPAIFDPPTRDGVVWHDEYGKVERKESH
jgi:hypothetical protein